MCAVLAIQEAGAKGPQSRAQPGRPLHLDSRPSPLTCRAFNPFSLQSPFLRRAPLPSCPGPHCSFFLPPRRDHSPP